MQPHDLAHLLDGARAEGDADVVDALHGVQVEIELALEAAEPADVDDATEHGRSPQVFVGDAGGHLVDDEVDALAAGRLEHLVRPILFASCRRRDRRRTP